MPIEDVEALVRASADDLNNLLDAKHGGPAPEAAAAGPGTLIGARPGAPAPAPASAAPGPAASDDGMFVDPETVHAATAKLAELGLLPAAVDTLTPDVLAVLTQIANEVAPELYDLTDERDVQEFLHGIAEGTIAPGPGPGGNGGNGGGRPL